MASEGMYYRMMGNTGLQVSVLSYGFWATYGVKDRLMENEGIEMAKKCMSIARNAGVNCFDHAEAYGNPNGDWIINDIIIRITRRRLSKMA